MCSVLASNGANDLVHVEDTATTGTLEVETATCHTQCQLANIALRESRCILICQGDNVVHEKPSNAQPVTIEPRRASVTFDR